MQNKEKKERAHQTDELEKTITTLERTLEDKHMGGQLCEQLFRCTEKQKRTTRKRNRIANYRCYFEVTEPLVQ